MAQRAQGGQGGGRTLLLCGHVDTVTVEGMTGAHTPRIDGDRLYGRGAYDMKAGVAAALVACREAAALGLAGDVVVAAVAGLVGVLIALWGRGRLAPMASVAWGLAWVAVARFEGPLVSVPTAVAAVVAAAAVVVVTVAFVGVVVGRRRHCVLLRARGQAEAYLGQSSYSATAVRRRFSSTANPVPPAANLVLASATQAWNSASGSARTAMGMTAWLVPQIWLHWP